MIALRIAANATDCGTWALERKPAAYAKSSTYRMPHLFERRSVELDDLVDQVPDNSFLNKVDCIYPLSRWSKNWSAFPMRWLWPHICRMNSSDITSQWTRERRQYRLRRSEKMPTLPSSTVQTVGS
jgi:hypothetical protein